MSDRQVILTADGSSSIYVPELDEHYHSTHGAIQESRHVFIASGLDYVKKGKNKLNILEIGLGTGLNCLLTMREEHPPITYIGIEKYPVTEAQWTALNYTDTLGDSARFKAIHDASWDTQVLLEDGFDLIKRQGDLMDVDLGDGNDLVYFDAFGPRAQPGLWTEEVFHRVVDSMAEGGVLVTYCSKGAARRAMMAAGLDVEKLPGPPGKREMVRATRNG